MFNRDNRSTQPQPPHPPEERRKDVQSKVQEEKSFMKIPRVQVSSKLSARSTRTSNAPILHTHTIYVAVLLYTEPVSVSSRRECTIVMRAAAGVKPRVGARGTRRLSTRSANYVSLDTRSALLSPSPTLTTSLPGPGCQLTTWLQPATHGDSEGSTSHWSLHYVTAVWGKRKWMREHLQSRDICQWRDTRLK